MPTAQQVIDKCQLDFPSRSDTECLDDLQELHNEICFKLKLAPATQTLSSLVAGTASYALASGTARVYEVRYYTSATSYHKLNATHIDELSTTRFNWRTESGTPDSFALQAGNIILVPNPSTSSVANYPQVQVDHTLVTTLSIGDSLPTGLISYKAWIDGLKMKSAARLEDPRLGYYKTEHERGIKLIYDQLYRMAAEFTPRINPPGSNISFRTRP